MKVKLEDIIEAMEFANMETEYYYDTHNEKVLMLFDGMVDGEDNPELFEDIKEGFVEDYIPLPGQYDINEYRIMEEFIYELPAGKNQDVLARTIQGRGAFRRFKDKLYDLNLEKQWYQYREEAYEKIARNGLKDIRLILLNERKRCCYDTHRRYYANSEKYNRCIN